MVIAEQIGENKSVLICSEDAEVIQQARQALLQNGLSESDVKGAQSHEQAMGVLGKLASNRKRIAVVLVIGNCGGADRICNDINVVLQPKFHPSHVLCFSDDTSKLPVAIKQQLMPKFDEDVQDSSLHTERIKLLTSKEKSPFKKGDAPLEWLSEEGDGPSLIHHLTGERFAALDFDGTLGRKFLMGTFLNFLQSNKKFIALLKNYDVEFGTNKVTQLNDLIESFSSMSKTLKVAKTRGEDPYAEYGGYENFLDQMADGYANILKGLGRSEVMEFSRQFADDCFEDVMYDHSQGIIDELNAAEIVPALVSGAPREAIQHIAKKLGIEEQGHYLECEVKNGVYTGKVVYNTGIGKVKTRVVARMMHEGNNYPAFSAGDSNTSDVAMMQMTFSSEVKGAGIFFAGSPKAAADATNQLANGLQADKAVIIHLYQNDRRDLTQETRALLETTLQIEDIS